MGEAGFIGDEFGGLGALRVEAGDADDGCEDGGEDGDEGWRRESCVLCFDLRMWLRVC